MMDTQTVSADVAAADLLRGAVDWTWETDESGQLVFLSDGLTRLAGRPAGVFKESRFADFGVWIEPNVCDFTETWAFRQARPFRNFAMDLIEPNGCARRQTISGVPIFDHRRGGFQGFRGTGVDIWAARPIARQLAHFKAEIQQTLSMLRDQNEELGSALQQAQSDDQSKTQFLAQMSHELRTPLNGIVGYAQAVRAGAIPPDVKKYGEIIEEIGRAGEHLQRMIGDMIDWAAIERQTLELAQTELDIGDVIEDAYSMVRPDVERLGLSVEDIPVPEKYIIVGDYHRLVQVFVNLFQNVLRYGSSGGRFGVSVDQQSKVADSDVADAHVRDKTSVEIEVWDAGPGIPPEKREEIFHAFVQAGGSQGETKEKGLGLGLPLSRQLIRSMSGELWASESGCGGAAFRLRLPAAFRS